MNAKKSLSMTAAGGLAAGVCALALAAGCAMARSNGLTTGRAVWILSCVCLFAGLFVQIRESRSEVVLDEQGVQICSKLHGNRRVAWEDCGAIGVYRVYFLSFIEYLVFAESPCEISSRKEWRRYARRHHKAVIRVERRAETMAGVEKYAPPHLVSKYKALPEPLMRAPVSVEFGIIGIILMAAGAVFFSVIMLTAKNVPAAVLVFPLGCAAVCAVLCVLTVENSSPVVIDEEGIRVQTRLSGERRISWENCGAIGIYGFYYGLFGMMVFSEERRTFSSTKECRKYCARHGKTAIQMQYTAKVMEAVEKYAPAHLVGECKRLIPNQEQ